MHRYVPKKVYHWSRTLHIYASLISLVAVLFFAFTGWVINHPSWFELKTPRISEENISIPEEIADSSDKLEVVEYLRAKEKASGAVKSFSQTDEQTDVHFVSPGRAQRFTITRLSGETKVLQEQYNTLSVLGDLHKAQYTGPAWSIVVDASAWFLMIVSITGLVLWTMLVKRRKLGIISLVAGTVGVVGVCLWLMP